MQRSFLLLAKGEFAAAFSMYPAIYTTLLLALFIGLHFLDRSRNYIRILWILAILNTVVVLASYAFKMLQ